MRIAELMRVMSSEIVDNSSHPSLEAFLESCNFRFQTEGIPFLDVLHDAYKTCVAEMCTKGRLPRTVKGLGPLPLDESGYPWCPPHLLMGFFSWPAKLSVEGVNPPADYAGFLARSHECANWAGKTWEDVLPLSQSDRRTIRELLTPRGMSWKHGPGATAEKLRGWDKYLALPPQAAASPFIRMTDVPKDRRKRRIIGIEPARAQWVQQGLAAALRSTRYMRMFTTLEDQGAHVRFAEQSLRQRPRCENRVTVDLSDASDHIPCSLVEYFLGSRWYSALAGASSAYASLPKREGGAVVPLGMMATMGNGFCFELETIIFGLMAALAVKAGNGMSLMSNLARVRVYGDDVILPKVAWPEFSAILQKCGMVANTAKTALTEEYLETCGHHIMKSGTFRRLCPTLSATKARGGYLLSFESGSALLGCADTFYQAGFPRTGQTLAASTFKEAQYRWNSSLQRHEIKLSTVVSATRPTNVEEATRYFSYWKTGQWTPSEEDTGALKRVYRWVPIRDHSHLSG